MVQEERDQQEMAVMDAITTGNGTFTPEQVRRFQDLLIQARKNRGLTQSQAAEKIGVSQTLISSLERGPHEGMRVKELFRILQAYGIEPNQMAEALGFWQGEEETITDPRLSSIFNRLQHMEPDDLDVMLTALEWMLRGQAR